jgi:uncharacterized protein YjbI with pentapeptide repeats
MASYETAVGSIRSERPLPHILEAHLKWLKGWGGERADLRQAVLRQARLDDATLVGANLREADLDGACLNHSDLSGADLGKARLDRARLILSRFVAANLRSASLFETVSSKADFTESNLVRANLSRASLHGAIFRGADLREANLNGTNLVRADLREANLAGAELTETVLTGANLTGADLRGSKLIGANLLGADLSGARLQSADLRDAKLTDCLFKGSYLNRADLTGADLNGACLDGADLSGWVVRRTTCNRLVESEHGEIILFGPGEFEKQCFQPEQIMELSLHVPLTVAAAYIAKFITQSINMALGSTVIVLKSLEALSAHETRIVLASLEGGLQESELHARGVRIEKELNNYFLTHPLKKDHLYLREMLSDSSNGAIDFRSCHALFQAPWQINPRVVKDEIAEEYGRLAQLCEALRALIFSVLASRRCEQSSLSA